jgi:sulfhydrogenase subunit beta (sulfur reductase)
MGKKIFISTGNLLPALDRLAGQLELWVPAASGKDGGAVRFRRYGPGITPVFNQLTRLSPKETVQPQAESLLRFQYSKSADDAAATQLTLDGQLDARPRLVFGARPCDARAFVLTDQVFTGGPVVDGCYQARRENTLFGTLVCREGDSACFCSSVGGGPADTVGSDLRLIPVEGGMVVEALADRGATLLEGLGTPVTAIIDEAASRVVAEVSALHIGDLDTDGSVAAIKSRFEDMDYWREVAERCLGCGVCTFVCPTCYCFTITDEMKDLSGDRLRSWDSCMFCQYSLEASGHNPRPTKMERYRNRVGHKFSYFPEKYDGKFSCTGCGRCVRSCPVSIDIRKAVAGMKEKVCGCA